MGSVELGTALIAVLGAVGCSSPIPRFIAAPLVPDARALIVSAGDLVMAGSPESSVLIPLSNEDLPLHLDAVFYDAPLDELGLEAGVVVAQEHCARSCRVLDPFAVFAATLDASGGASAWEPRPRAVPETVARTLIPEPDRCTFCVTFDRSVVPLPAPRNINVRVAVETEAGVVLGLASGGLFRVGPDLHIERLCQEGALAIQDGAYDGAGHLWVVASSTLAQIDLTAQDPLLPCQTVSATVSPGSNYVQIAISGPEAPFEAYLLTRTGDLDRWTPAGFERLSHIDPTRGPNTSVRWIGPGRAVGTVDMSSFFEVEGGRARIERLRDAALEQVEINVIAPIGTSSRALFLSNGDVILRDRSTERVIDGGAWAGAGTFVPRGAGFFVTLGNGAHRQFAPTTGFCPPDSGFSNETVFRAATLGERVILGDILTNDLNHDSAIGVLTPRPPSCTP